MARINGKICKCVLGVVLASAICGCQYSQYSGNENAAGAATTNGATANETTEGAGGADISSLSGQNAFEAPDMDDIELKIDVDVDDIISKQKIIFIMQSTSFSEGYENVGYFVDNKGYRHFFDLTRYSLSRLKDDSDDDKDMYEYLLEHFDDYEKEEFLSVEDLKTCVRLLYNVDEAAEVVTDGEPAIADYPAHALYGVKNDGENINFLWLIDKGAYFTWLDDDCAKKIVELLGSDWMRRSQAMSEEDYLKWQEEWTEKRNMKKAKISGDEGTLTLYVPESWECVGFPQTEKNGTYSIRIKPDASFDGYISVSYEYQFGVCGTGLEEKEMRLAWDKAVAGYYDGSDKWSFIVYQGKNENIVALNNAGDWFDDYEDEIMKILDYMDFNPSHFHDYEHKSYKQDNGIGVSLTANNISATGAELYFISNSENTGHEYFYGDYYSLYVYNEKNKGFEPVFEGDMVFDDLAYNIKHGEASDFSINWEPVCGRLEPGLYRLEKIVNDKNYDPKKDEIRDYIFSVDFVIY